MDLDETLAIEKPDRRAEVRLDAFNFALARYSRLHDKACKVCWFDISLTYD